MKAQNLKILWLNHPQIWINGQLAKVGDVFNEKATIKWFRDKQAMKVMDIENGKRYLMVARPSEKRELSVLEILTRINHLSTHGPEDEIQESFDALENSIQSQYDLLDSIAIPTDIPVNDNCYFLGSYKYGDTRITKRLKFVDKHIIIDKTLFNVDNKVLDPRDISLRIDYVVKSLSNTIFIKNNIELTIIPEILK